MDISYTRRTRCELAGTEDLESLAVFESFPVFMGCTQAPAAQDVHSDMRWSISRSSGLVQLDQLLPLELLYPQAHGSGAVGAIWQKHHREFARFIHQYQPRSVLEIGGSHGVLACEYQALQDIPWHIIEPNPMPVEGCKASFTKGYFDGHVAADASYDLVTHSHVLEHIYHPHSFIAHISQVLSVGGIMCFTLPNMEVMLERKYSNCLNFEHTLYLTEPYIEHWLAVHGFELLQKEYFLADHSIFYAARKTDAAITQTLPPDLYARNKQIFLAYVQYFENLVEELNAKLALNAGPVYLFGAHVFSQYLVAFGLNTEKIACVLDNDPAKHGQRLYGTDLMVHAPSLLAGQAAAVVILKAGPYSEEIKTDIVRNINHQTIFWE